MRYSTTSHQFLPKIAIFVYLAASMSFALAEKDDPRLKDWIEGPVRYITTAAEAKTFRALETDNERALFVEKFWLRRDPTPETLVNEYREMFWRRVKEANDNFLDAPKPGWLTDRGKIHILYGPPTEIQDMPNLATESTDTSGRGLIRWIYEGRPSKRADLDAITVVPFVRDLSGEYRLSYDPNLASVFFDELAVREGRAQQLDRYLEDMGRHPLKSRLGVMLDLGKMQEVPPHEQVLIERVETMESFATVPLDVQIDRLRHPEETDPLVCITTIIPTHDPDVKPSVLARFTPGRNPGDPVLLGEGSFRYVEKEDGTMVAQARTTLPPDNWDLLVATATPYSASTGINRRVVVTQRASGSLELSDIVLAASLRPVEVKALASYDEPFILGAFEVVPLAGNRLAAGDSFRIYYEIYDGVPPYSIQYALEGKDFDERWVRLGKPAVLPNAQGSQGWEMPLGAGWPEGEYRVKVKVTDNAGASVEKTVPFSLVTGTTAAGPEDPSSAEN